MRQKKRFVSYKKAKLLAKKYKIKNCLEWYDLTKTNKTIPFDAHRIYKKDWINWYEFLGIKFPTFQELKNFAIQHNIQTSTQWKKFKKPKYYPSEPAVSKLYKKDWINWRDFLGKNFLEFEVCKEFARESGITSNHQWHEVSSRKLFPPGIPAAPEQIFGRK